MQHLVDVDDTQLVLHEAVVDGARPVLFLGRGRVGKSTIANKLLGVAGYNGESFPQIPGVNAVTRGVDCVYVADNGLVVMDCEGADNGEETASLLSALYGACIYSAHTVVLVCADHISDADIRVLARGVIASSYICGQQVTRRLVFVINKMDPDADNPEPHDYLHSKLYGTNPAMAFYCGVINHFFADARCFYEMHRPEPRDNLVIAAREIMDGAELMPEWTVRMNAGIVAANTLIIPNAAFSDADPLAVVREFCHRAIQDARDNTAAVQVNDYRRPDEMNNVLQADRDRVLSAYDVITHAWGGDATREVRDGYRDTLRAQVDVEHANLVDLNNARGMETREVLRDVHPIVVQTAVARVTRRAVRERFWGKDCPKAWYMNHKLVQKIGRSIVVRVNGEHVPGNWEAIEGASGEPYGRDWANEWDEGRDQPYDMHRVNVLWNDILNVQGRSVDEIRHIVNQRFGV